MVISNSESLISCVSAKYNGTPSFSKIISGLKNAGISSFVKNNILIVGTEDLETIKFIMEKVLCNFSDYILEKIPRKICLGF